MKPSTISKVLWASFILRGAAFLILILTTLLQGNLKRLLFSADPSVCATFTLPYNLLLQGLLALVLHLLLALLIPLSFKRSKRTIALEICGYVLFCGLFSIAAFFLNAYFSRVNAIVYGNAALASYVTLQNVAALLFEPLSLIATTLLCLALGLSIANKKALAAPAE